MAKAPKKSQDPTEAALSAIEEALQLGNEKSAESRESVEPIEIAEEQEQSRLQRRLSAAAPTAGESGERIEPEMPRAEPAREPIRESAREPVQAPVRRPDRPMRRAAANDDRQSVGQIIARLHSRPSRTPLVLASIMSALWVVGGIAWAISLYRQEFSLVEFLTNPVVFPVAAGLLLPAAGFLLLAVLIRRMQELRGIARSMTEVTVRLAEPENLSTDTVVTVGQAIRREVAALGDGIERAIARATELEAMVKNEVSTLERAYDDNEGRVRNLVDELQSERDSILSHAGRLRESIAHSHEAFTLDVEQIAERVNSGVTEATDRVSTVITVRSEEARAQIAAAGDLVIDAMTIKASETTERMTQVGIEVGKALASRSAMVSEAFEESANAVAAQIAATGHRAAEHLTDTTADLNGRVMTALENFDTTVKVQGASMVEQLTKIAEKTQRSVSEVAESFEARSARIEHVIEERTRSLDETLSNRTLEIARSLADGNKSANEAIEKTVAGMGEYFAEKAKEIAETISSRAEAADQTFGARAQQVAAEMAKRTETVADNLDTRINRFEGIIDGKFRTIAESIDGRAAEAAEAVARKVENVSETLRKNAIEVERLLGGLAEQVSKGLAERTREVGVTHEILRNDVSGILEKLGQANDLVKSVAEGVSTELLPMEKVVAERLTYLQTSLEATTASTRGAIEWADGQVRDLRDVAAGVLRDLSSLTLRFENQGRVISGVAETLSETHGRIDATLEERRFAIEEIVNLLVRRSDEFESKLLGRTHEIGERLKGFQQVLEDTLSGSQSRAEEITKLMADTTVHTTQQINSQYELIRGAYAEERGRTNVALKSTYQDAVDDMGRMFREMLEHFTESSRELRSVTEQVQNTLAETRDELKDGLKDLPNETFETTQAMRRMVADQLKAIAQLSEVISWRTRVTEVAEPADRRAAREEPSEDPRPARDRASVNGNGDGTHAHLARSRGAEPREQRPDDEARRPRSNDSYRASKPDARQAQSLPPPSPEPFDTLAGDIPRLVSHDAAIEAWDRYKRGERNVFTRKLYTTQGHRAFEEIRRKYRRSGDFRETVDRYIDEFEHLLDQVARDDRGQVLTKTYLNSDTGKVYTLLAHAAGRLE
jgi:hypothetical protein